MESLINNPIVLAALSLALTAAALVWSIRQEHVSPRSRRWFAVALVPGLLAISAFYSLAVHMHARLGGWPEFYGTQGLPEELITHHEFAGLAFTLALLLGIGMPLVMAFLAMAPRLRSNVIYPAVCGLSCWVCLLLTALAPTGFQRWWWD